MIFRQIIAFLTDQKYLNKGPCFCNEDMAPMKKKVPILVFSKETIVYDIVCITGTWISNYYNFKKHNPLFKTDTSLVLDFLT